MSTRLLGGRAESGVCPSPSRCLHPWGCPSRVPPLPPSPGHRPHVPPEVSLPPRDEPAVHQAEDAAARVHHQALRGEGDLPGVQRRDAQLGFGGGFKRRFWGLIVYQGVRDSPGSPAWGPHLPAWSSFPALLCHQVPHREVFLFARFTSFWIKTTTRSVRMCWTFSSAAGPR